VNHHYGLSLLLFVVVARIVKNSRIVTPVAQWEAERSDPALEREQGDDRLTRDTCAGAIMRIFV
jgi:hypothetical protein